MPYISRIQSLETKKLVSSTRLTFPVFLAIFLSLKHLPTIHLTQSRALLALVTVVLAQVAVQINL